MSAEQQVTRFQNSLTELCDKNYRKISEKSECEENLKKLNSKAKTKPTLKQECFEFWKLVMECHIAERVTNIELDSLIDTLISLLQNYHRLNQELKIPELWNDILTLAVSVLNYYQKMNEFTVDFNQFRRLWEFCMSILDETMEESGDRKTRLPSAELLSILVKEVHLTEYNLKISQIIERIKQISDKYSWHRGDKARTSFLIVLNTLIEKYAIGKRELLLSSFQPIFDFFLASNDRKLISTDYTNRHGSPPIDGSSFNQVLYEFVEKIIILTYPGCETFDKSDINTAIRTLNVLLDDLEVQTHKALRTSSKCTIPDDRLSLISRLYVIIELNRRTIGLIPDHPESKRLKLGYNIYGLMEEKPIFANFQILHHILSKNWWRKLPDDLFETVLQRLLILDKNYLKKDDKLELYLRCLNILFEKQWNIKPQILDELWNWTLSLVHMPNLQDVTLEFIHTLLPHVERELSGNRSILFSILIANFSRLGNFGEKAIKLLGLLIRRFEFDERSDFRVELITRTSDPRDAEWKFRLQLIYALLQDSSSGCDPSDIADVVRLLLVYHPNEIPEAKKSNCARHTFESLIEEWYCPRLLKAELSHNVPSSSPAYIHFLIERLNKVFRDLWDFFERQFNDEKCLHLWKVFTNLRASPDLSHPLSDLQTKFDSFVLGHLIEACTNGVQFDYSQLDIKGSWSNVSQHMKGKLESLAAERHPLYRFVVNWSNSIPPEFLRALLVDPSAENLDCLETIIIEISRNDLGFFDLLSLIERFYHVLSKPFLNKLIDSLINEVEAEINSQRDESETARFYKDKAAEVVFRLADTDYLECETYLQLMSWTTKEIKYLRLPKFITEVEMLEKVSPEPTSNPSSFCHFLNNVLSNVSTYDSHSYFLSRSLDLDEKIYEQFIPNYRELLRLHEKSLYYYAKKHDIKSNTEFERRILTLDQSPLHGLLFEENPEIGASQAVDLFFLPSKVLEEICKRRGFQVAFKKLLIFQKSSEFMNYLRSELYRLSSQETASIVPYSLIVLSSMCTIMENLNLDDDKGFVYRDLASILFILLDNLLDTFKSEKDLLLPLVQRIYNLLDRWSSKNQISKMSIFSLVDLFYHRFSPFPKTFIFFHDHTNSEISNYVKILEEDKALNLNSMSKTFIFNPYQTKELNRDNPYLKLNGFWKLLSQATIKDPKLLTEHNFRVIQEFWLYFPKLRQDIVGIIVRYPMEYRKNSLRFLLDGLKRKDYKEIPAELLFDSNVLFSPLMTTACYNMLSYHSNFRNVISIGTRCSNHSDHLACDLLAEVFYDLELPRHIELLKPLVLNSPLYASVLLAQLPQFCQDKKRLVDMIGFINDIVEKILLDDQPKNEYDALFLLAIVGLIEELPDFVKHLDLLKMAKSLVKFSMFDFASYFLKRFIDSREFHSRNLYLFKNEDYSSFLAAVDSSMKEEIAELLIRISIGRNDLDQIITLPLEFAHDPRVRISLAKNKCDWVSVVSGNYASETDSVMANYYLGNKSADCNQNEWRNLENWDELTNRVSYTKKLMTHNERLYSLLKLVYDGELDEARIRTRKFMINSELDAAKMLILDEQYSDVCRQYQSLNMVVCQEKPPNVDNDLIANFHLALLASKRTPKNASNTRSCINSMKSYLSQLVELKAYHPALQFIEKCEKVTRIDQAPFVDLQVEKAKVLKASGEGLMATYLFKQVLNTNEEVSRSGELLSKLKVEVHLQLADGLVQNAQAYDHLKAACQLSTNSEHEELIRYINHVKLANRAEKRYHELVGYMEGPAYRLKRNAIRTWNMECSNSGSDTDSRELERKRRELHCETRDIKQIDDDRLRYLQETVKNYLLALQIGNFDKVIVHKLTSLFMQNKNERFLNGIISILDAITPSVWIPVFNILSSHLFDKDLPIYGVAERIISRTLVAHPYHVVNSLLFYLKNSSHDADIALDRRSTVKSLLMKSFEQNKEFKRVVMALVDVHGMLCDFGSKNVNDANYFTQAAQNGKTVYLLSDRFKLLQNIAKLQETPIPIIDQPLNPAGVYNTSEMILFSRVYDYCEKADGLSAPKVLKLVGNNGIEYKAIFKGEDLRQDSLVQQLFTVCNLLMEQNPACKDGFKPLRTYNVIPLYLDCGIIEWCQKTSSMCSVLVGADKKGGLHKKYRPNDITAAEARNEMHQGRIYTRDDSEACFLKICEKISPVFRHFFYENFHQPSVYHDRILNYTQSLAQWSIVCYLVGLGDRHLNNILLDTQHGELVHIDLGMIFEYSKRVLPIPEKIPFRLTRDFCDPVLIDGINGRFKRLAVHTLQQLRENSQVLIGIASILLHDPISSFVDNSTGQDNRQFFAETAILRLREKLAGRDVTLVEQTPEQQFMLLLREATSAKNLSQVFAGWMPFI